MGPTPLIWAYKLICTRRIGFRHHIYGPVTIYMSLSSKLIPASFRHWLYGPVTTFMGLGPRNQCRAHETCVGPTKPVSGPYIQCRGKIGEIFYGQAHEISVGPTKTVSGPRNRCRAHENVTEKYTKIDIWACYRWNFGKRKTSRCSYTLGLSFSAKKTCNFTVPLRQKKTLKHIIWTIF